MQVGTHTSYKARLGLRHRFDFGIYAQRAKYFTIELFGPCSDF
jgi:hypothetical protein